MRIWSTFKMGCINGNNNRTFKNVLTYKECQTKCDSETNYNCRSISYQVRTKICNLSTLESTSPSFEQPCKAGLDWVYSEVIPEPGTS